MFDSEDRDPLCEPSIWIHRATFTYRLSRPVRRWETLWVQRAGWGLLKRKDLWMPTILLESELEKDGFVRLEPKSEFVIRSCSTCKTLIVDIPGALARKHFQQCGTFSGEWRKLDEFVLEEQRLKIAEERIKKELLDKQLEKEAELKRERLERIREEAAARQTGRDRKRRLKEDAKEHFIRS